MVEDMGDFGTGSTPPPPPGELPGQRRSRSRARGAAAGVGVALVVGAGGIAVATSGSPSSSASPGAAPTSEGAPTPGPAKGLRGGGPGKIFGGLGRGAGIGGAGPVLHGTFVVAKSGGGYQTVQVQTGTVNSVSSTSLAVTSKDGFTFTYVVKAGTTVDAQRDGITSVKKGDQVVVSATLSGSTGTVDRVTDTTELQQNLPNLPEGGFLRGPGGAGHGQRAPQSAPATPGTGT
ncbi:MAG: hypothetical protein QOF39_500 [Frankiales bacterium]|jgi:preprotein translocase subunit YajC|nr:hypothetical protein [Frankiales bacterium]